MQQFACRRELDYDTAVHLADTALTAIFDQLERPDSIITYDDRRAAGSAFRDWLREHPDVESALIEEASFREGKIEDYIARHSIAWEIGYFDAVPDRDTIGEQGWLAYLQSRRDKDPTADSVLIRRMQSRTRGDKI